MEKPQGGPFRRPKVEPLYTIEDAENVKQYVTTCEYGEDVELCEGVSVRFDDAGHLLGSACITVTATENGVTKKLIFSGDLGNVDQPIIPGLHRLASGPPCHHHFHRRSGRLSGCRRAGAGAGRHPHVQLLQPPHDGDGGGIQGAERGRHSQGHHLRLRYVRRGPYPSPPEAQPLEAGVHHRVRGLSGGGHLGPLPCWRASEV